jgi:hypothetical protein
MVKVCIPFRLAVQIGVVLAILSAATVGFAQCVGIHEEGRWRNLDPKGDPSYIDVKTVGGCGDVSYNGQPAGSAMHYKCGYGLNNPAANFMGALRSKQCFLFPRGKNGCVATFQQAAMWTKCGCAWSSAMVVHNCML